MISVKLLEADDKTIKVELEGVPLSIANAIRRFAINEVPTMAVEEILLIENTSAMPNDVLAHRISLIPF
ncbi:MAG TPA: hypothetical protein ENG18_00510, partial [Nitrososphaeria archaeon]|nr:hypothetical protein [Nitrososphaeria archaeon]